MLEWPAVRLTAAAFALVGDFENAVYCWRTQARTWPDPDAGIVLAAGAGAMGVRLGMPVQEVDGLQPRPSSVRRGGRRPFLDTTVGMLWRALVLWVRAASRDRRHHRAHRRQSRRSAPQFQHWVNCGPGVSPQAQSSRVRQRAPAQDSWARGTSASFITHSSAWHSAGGSSPIADDSMAFRTDLDALGSSRFLA